MATKFQILVIDSGPLIQNSLSPSLAESFYTVPEVIGEIKDVVTRERLSRLPFELKIKNPSVSALQTVREFAKITGDLASLSPVDLKVVALTLMLELEKNGADKTRTRTNPPKVQIHEGTLPRQRHVKKNDLLPNHDSFDIGSTRKDLGDEEGWITPDNIDDAKKSAHSSSDFKGNQTEVSKFWVGCISTDFAVQNLLLQLGLNAYGPEGYRIRQVKNWLLRCHACYWTTKEMKRRFCDRCGNPTLIRTSYMVDAEGVVHLFLKKNFQYNNRGTIAPLPSPRPGRNGNKILLREDQKEYQLAMKSYERQERKAGGLRGIDAIDDRLATVFGTMDIKGVAKDLSNRAPPIIGFGRKNPNQSRRKI